MLNFIKAYVFLLRNAQIYFDMTGFLKKHKNIRAIENFLFRRSDDLFSRKGNNINPFMKLTYLFPYFIG
jgi:hypothetical protein